MKTLSKKANLFLKNNKTRTIVFTNGCFDIVHCGHIKYLNSAKEKGNLLFVGLNSDKSIKSLKGKDRPINGEQERKFFLENLKSVDFVEIFDEETPFNLIKEVRPDVLVKGGDWATDQIIGSEFVLSYGGSVESLLFVEGQSTTKIIQELQGRL
jgi:rfaE bifunctional protein nucleotidyltransferase chain/domain